MVTRRELLKSLSATATLSLAASASRWTSAAPSMKYGYAAITWGNDVMQAIEDVAAGGFRGMQLRTGDGTLARWSEKTSALGALLGKRSLTLGALLGRKIAIGTA